MGFHPDGVTMRYWPKDKPIPDGWYEIESFRQSHHFYYSILIKKEGTENAGTE